MIISNYTAAVFGVLLGLSGYHTSDYGFETKQRVTRMEQMPEYSEASNLYQKAGQIKEQLQKNPAFTVNLDNIVSTGEYWSNTALTSRERALVDEMAVLENAAFKRMPAQEYQAIRAYCDSRRILANAAICAGVGMVLLSIGAVGAIGANSMHYLLEVNPGRKDLF